MGPFGTKAAVRSSFLAQMTWRDLYLFWCFKYDIYHVIITPARTDMANYLFTTKLTQQLNSGTKWGIVFWQDKSVR